VTPDELAARALATGLTWAQLELEPFRAVLLRLWGHARNQELAERAAWERTRWLATLLLQPHTRKGQRLQPKDLAVFPWERRRRKQLSREEYERIQAFFDKWHAQEHGKTG